MSKNAMNIFGKPFVMFFVRSLNLKCWGRGRIGGKKKPDWDLNAFINYRAGGFTQCKMLNSLKDTFHIRPK